MRKTKQQQNRQLFLIYGIIYVFLVYLCIVFAPYWTGTLIDSLPKMAAMPKSAFWHLQKKSIYVFNDLDRHSDLCHCDTRVSFQPAKYPFWRRTRLQPMGRCQSDQQEVSE